jgi:hypothetical protein
MAAGIEIAGLALATLPLLIQIAKDYDEGINSVRDLLSNRRRDAALKSDYELLAIELFFLKTRLRAVVLDLPDLCIGFPMGRYDMYMVN